MMGLKFNSVIMKYVMGLHCILVSFSEKAHFTPIIFYCLEGMDELS